jgi:predicted RNA binding protein YcfA (HicA-like mRNA interferase family)
MTSFFPDVNSSQIIKVLTKIGFKFSRQSGTSHAIYRRESDGSRTTVPTHGKKSLKIKTIKSICKDAKITVEELRKLLEQI